MYKIIMVTKNNINMTATRGTWQEIRHTVKTCQAFGDIDAKLPNKQTIQKQLDSVGIYKDEIFTIEKVA